MNKPNNEKPNVIFGDIIIRYYEEAKTKTPIPSKKKQELKEVEFKREPVTVFDDLETIPYVLMKEYVRRYENIIRGKSTKKIKVVEVEITNYHSYHGKVNYEHKDGWATKNPEEKISEALASH